MSVYKWQRCFTCTSTNDIDELKPFFLIYQNNTLFYIGILQKEGFEE